MAIQHSQKGVNDMCNLLLAGHRDLAGYSLEPV